MLNFIRNKKNLSFIRFWFAQLISQFGDRVHQMALVGLIASRAPGSSFELAKLLSFTIIPVFIIGPVAGVCVDRWDRRTVLFVCDFLRGLLVLSMAWWLMDFSSLIPVYVTVFLIFSLSRFYVPAKMAVIPEMVEAKDLHIANSLVTVTGMIALVGGAVMGGLIVEKFGSRGGFLWDAVTFFISGALVFSMQTIKNLQVEASHVRESAQELIKAQRGFWAEIQEGVDYIRSQQHIRVIFVMMTILFAAAGAVYVVSIVFIQNAFGTVTKDLGFLAIPLGIGLFLGSMAFGKWGKRVSKLRIIFMSLILGGAMVAMFAFLVATTQHRQVAMGLALLLGLVVGPSVIAANTVVHEVCESKMSGKVFAALEFVMHLAFLASMLSCSFLAEHMSRMWILIGVGGIFILVGLSGLIRESRS